MDEVAWNKMNGFKVVAAYQLYASGSLIRMCASYTVVYSSLDRP